MKKISKVLRIPQKMVISIRLTICIDIQADRSKMQTAMNKNFMKADADLLVTFRMLFLIKKKKEER